MQFKVPQNIDMQDRIIGPLTLGQFFYLLFGGLTIYILFNKLVLAGLSFFFWILAIPTGLLSFAMAFLKVNDRPFPFFFLAAIRFLSQPRQRVWQHSAEAAPKKPVKVRPDDNSTVVPRKSLDTVKVRELADILDKGGANGLS